MEVKKKKFFIYALIHPVTKVIRYIGKTNDCYKREHEHNTRPGKTLKDKWIESLKEKGKNPIFEILEECNENNWHRREKFYIEKYNTKKNSLLNSYKGIRKRTNQDERQRIKDILNQGEFYQYEFSEKYPRNLIIKLKNGKYWRVYGNERRLPGHYFYIFSKNKRYFIPKASIIYKVNLNSLQVVKDNTHINKGFQEDILRL